MICYRCGAPLTPDEIAIHRKLVNRGAQRHLCKACLAAAFQVPVSMIEERIEYFRRTGCMLFAQPGKGEQGENTGNHGCRPVEG